METRPFGCTGIRVPVLGFGAMQVGDVLGAAAELVVALELRHRDADRGAGGYAHAAAPPAMPIAAAALFEFAVIILVAHWAQGFGWSRGGWEYPLFWALIILAIALRGGGPYSLDRKLGWEL